MQRRNVMYMDDAYRNPRRDQKQTHLSIFYRRPLHRRGSRKHSTVNHRQRPVQSNLRRSIHRLVWTGGLQAVRSLDTRRQIEADGNFARSIQPRQMNTIDLTTLSTNRLSEPVDGLGKYCVICMYNIFSGMFTLKCKHSFHAVCIVRWYREKLDCPTCLVLISNDVYLTATYLIPATPSGDGSGRSDV